jgi:hypothetical protein
MGLNYALFYQATPFHQMSNPIKKIMLVTRVWSSKLGCCGIVVHADFFVVFERAILSDYIR